MQHHDNESLTIEKNLYSSIGEERLWQLAHASGFAKRMSGRLTPLAFASCLLGCASKPKTSFRILASWIATNFLKISKQALWKRMNDNAVGFLEAILGDCLKKAAKSGDLQSRGIFKHFSRVLLQDSTSLSLPVKFRELYPGAANIHATHATMKIQLIYDLIADLPVNFSLSSFRRNDQAAAFDIVKLIKKGDLVLRDLGYFVIDSFRKIADLGAFFLSRYKHGTNLYSKANDKRAFDLAGHLRKMKKKGVKTVDLNLFLGAEQRLPVRVVAIKLPDHVAAERKRKAKNNRDQSLNPSADRLSMLNWEIFLTNIGESVWNTETVAEVYGFRWKIEMIFKLWKSYFSLPDIPRSCSAQQLHCLVYARLTFATIFHTAIWIPCKNALTDPKNGIWISPFKLADLALAHSNEFRSLITDGVLEERLSFLVREFAIYDKRRRLSFEEITFHYLAMEG